jgi:FtsH-binding integral membrane protein
MPIAAHGKQPVDGIPVGIPMGLPVDGTCARPSAYGKAEHQAQYSDVELGGIGAPGAGGSAEFHGQVPEGIRAGFIRKVYGILTAQMLFTVVLIASCMLVPSVRSVIIALFKIPLMQIMMFVPTIGVMCALQKYKDQHPTNYQLLAAFTVLVDLPLGFMCAIYYQAGLGILVLQAFLMTVVCFGTLTCYAMYSGKDFSWMGGMLSMGLMGMVMWGFLASIFGVGGGLMYSACGVILFCGFILYDTQRIMEVYGPDDYIMAVIDLYLNIVNLFTYLLELLSSLSGDDN